MISDQRLQWLVFCAGCVLILCVEAAQLWAIRPLLAQGAVRAEAQKALQAITDREGWLLSDVELQSVSETGARIVHLPHGRHAEPGTCFDLTFSGSTLHPCAGS